MTTYQIKHASGVEYTSNAKTLEGAKREASRDMTHGGGAVTVCDEAGEPICRRAFAQTGKEYGWSGWESVGA